MKQLKNFLIKREQSQARLSFAKREKSRLLAKTLLTLVALLAVTTGAWAQDYYAPSTDEVIILNDVYDASKSGYSSHSAIAWGGAATPSMRKAGDPNNEGQQTSSTVSCYTVKGTDQGKNITLSITGVSKVIVYHERNSSRYIELREGSKTGNIIGSGEKNTLYTEVELTATNKYSIFLHGTSNGSDDADFYVYAIKLIAAPASSGPEVAWDKAEKSGSFTMPGGNVTLEPEYYPQATVAEGAVTAADADARATTDDPLVKVDATKLTGAKKLMYFVSNSGTTAPAYDAEGWTDQLPTAEGFTQQGIVYVWYYPVGTDEDVDEATATYSDGDICLQSITARIADAPTYAVTFAEGVNPEPPAEPEWTASPAADVTKGQTVTVTYSGTKKVIGVKAEKKAAAPAETTVTLTPGEIGDLSIWGSNSKTINGITIAVSGDSYFNTAGLMQVSGYDPETGEPISATGTFTFTSSVGNIKRIDINHNSGRWWGSGAGWPGSYEVYDTSTFTWSGTPAASVTLSGSFSDEHDCSLYDVSSFVFTIEPTN